MYKKNDMLTFYSLYISKKSSHPEIQPAMLAPASRSSTILAELNNCIISRMSPYAIDITNEYVTALVRSLGKRYCLIKPTIISKTNMQKTNAWANLSMLSR